MSSGGSLLPRQPAPRGRRVTCTLCGCEVELLLGGPDLPGQPPPSREGPILRPGLERTLGGLGLQEHRSEDRAPTAPVGINRILLHTRVSGEAVALLGNTQMLYLKSNGPISTYVL